MNERSESDEKMDAIRAMAPKKITGYNQLTQVQIDNMNQMKSISK